MVFRRLGFNALQPSGFIVSWQRAHLTSVTFSCQEEKTRSLFFKKSKLRNFKSIFRFLYLKSKKKKDVLISLIKYPFVHLTHTGSGMVCARNLGEENRCSAPLFGVPSFQT